MFTSPQEVLDFIKNEEVVFVDVRFTDMPGVQQHFNLPAKAIDDDFFVNGQLFDSRLPGHCRVRHAADPRRSVCVR